MLNGERFFTTYVTKPQRATLLDIGAQNVNGTLKTVCPPHVTYIGVDVVLGAGVDVVIEDPYKLPFEDDSVELIVSSSCFEHSEMFWLTYLEIMRVLKPAGLFYLNAPSNGAYHRYPVDCWRFYPDCGTALVNWGKKNGFRSAMLESYISNALTEGWKDFVCVLVKDENHAGEHAGRILDSFEDFTTGVVRTTNGLLEERNPPSGGS